MNEMKDVLTSSLMVFLFVKRFSKWVNTLARDRMFGTQQKSNNLQTNLNTNLLIADIKDERVFPEYLSRELATAIV
jgi:hypothetical protein